MHIELTLPARIKVGPAQSSRSGVRAVTTDGGHVVRNQRWSSPLRAFTAAFPKREADHADFVAVRQIWHKTREGTHSFNLVEWIDGETVRVRFVGELDIVTPIRFPQHEIEPLTLEEVRDVSPVNTALPAITGTVAVGQTLSVGNGSWSGAPVSYAYQWLRGGEEIAGATSATYLLAAPDLGTMIACDVIATAADGGDTLITAAAVGPILP